MYPAIGPCIGPSGKILSVIVGLTLSDEDLVAGDSVDVLIFGEFFDLTTAEQEVRKTCRERGIDAEVEKALLNAVFQFPLPLNSETRDIRLLIGEDFGLARGILPPAPGMELSA